MPTATDDLRAQVGVVGDKEAKAALGGVEAAEKSLVDQQEKVTSGSKKMGGGLLNVSKASKNAGRDLGMNVNVLGETAFMMGNVIPSMREFGMTLVMAGGNAVQLGASLGPIGVAVAGLTAAIPLLISGLSDTSDETIRAGKSASAAAKDFRDLASSIREAVRQQMDLDALESGRSAVRQRFTASERKALEQQTEDVIERLEEVRRMAQIEKAQALDPDVQQAAAARLEAVNDELRRRRQILENLGTVTQSEIRAEVEGDDGGGGGGGGVSHSAQVEEAGKRARAVGQAKVEADEDTAEDRARIRQQELAARERHWQQLMRSERSVNQQLLEDARELADEAQREFDQFMELQRAADEAAGDFASAWEDGIDRVKEAFDEYNEKARAAGRETLDQGDLMQQSAKATAGEISGMIGDKAGGAFEEAIGSILDGSASAKEAFSEMAKAAVQSVVQESIVRAAFHAAAAVGSLATFNFAAAAQHATAAAMYGAVGGVAAGVGLATGAFGGGGNQQEAEQEQERERPDDRPETQQQIVYNVNFNAPLSAVRTGRAVSEIEESSRRRLGERSAA